MQTLGPKKFKYNERYTDPYTEKEKIDKKLEKRNQTKMTIGELLDEWWEHHQKNLRPSSIVSDSRALKYVRENVEMDVLITKVDVKFFQKFINQLSFPSEYNKKIKSILNKAFKYAVNLELIHSNPLERVMVPKKIVTLNNFERVEHKYLEEDEVRVLLDAYYERFQSYRLGQLAEFMYLTGIRVGEAISLKGENYHEEAGVIDIHGTLDYSSGYKNAQKEMTKTISSYREVELCSRGQKIINDVIIANKIKHSSYSDQDYLFIGKTGKPIQVNSFKTSIKTINHSLGENMIKNKELSSHIFRHSHISLLAELNIPIKAIMERVGHKDEKTTLKIYTHVTKKQKAGIIEKLNNKWESSNSI